MGYQIFPLNKTEVMPEKKLMIATQTNKTVFF
jgi:hypothetical protein